MIRLSGYDYESFADADGVSCVLFISGCKHYCNKCHSPQTHNFDNGLIITDEVINRINNEIDKRPFLNALVLSGGDPMYSAKEIVDYLIPKLHIPNNNLWCYTGFKMEEVQSDFYMNRLLEKCTHLIDGMFEYDKRDITLKFRGSSNQHIWVKQNNIWKIEE